MINITPRTQFIFLQMVVNCTFVILLFTDRIDAEQEEKLKSSVPDLLEGERSQCLLNLLWAIFF